MSIKNQLQQIKAYLLLLAHTKFNSCILGNRHLILYLKKWQLIHIACKLVITACGNVVKCCHGHLQMTGAGGQPQ